MSSIRTKQAPALKTQQIQSTFASAKGFKSVLTSFLLLGLLILPHAALAQTINEIKLTGNVNGPIMGTSGDDSSDYRLTFTAGFDTDGYSVTRVDVSFSVTDGTQPTYAIEIWSLSGLRLGTKLVSLTKSTPLTNGLNTFQVPESDIFTLTNKTTYALVYDVTAQGDAGAVKIDFTNNNEDSDGERTAGNLWSIADNHRTRAWDSTDRFPIKAGTDPIRFAIYGATKKDPTVSFNTDVEEPFGPVKTDIALSATGLDPDGGPVTYAWSAKRESDNTPVNNYLTVNSTDNSKATFNADTDTWGRYIVTVTVTDDEGDTVSAEITVIATDATSRDPSLSALALVDNDGTALALTPAFASATTEYTATLSHATPTFKLTATLTNGFLHNRITFTKSDGTTGSDTDVFHGIQQTFVQLTPGANIVEIDAGSRDRTGSRIYTVTVNLIRPPTAALDPSTNQSVQAGTDLALTASGMDPDGGDVTLAWAVTDSSDAAVTGVLTVNSNDSTMATFNGSTVGTYTVTLTVTDDEMSTATATIDVTVTASPPTAAITPSGTVNVLNGRDLDLTGSGMDADGGAVTFSWAVTDSSDAAVNNVLTVDSNDSTMATLNTTTADTYTVTLTVTDDEGDTTTATVTVIVAASVPPTVTLTPSGNNHAVVVDEDFMLTASATEEGDPDATFTYVWAAENSDGNDRTSTVLTGTTTSSTTLNSSVEESYTVSVTVTDDDGQSTKVSVTVDVTEPEQRLVLSRNTLTVAEAGGTDTWTVALNIQPTGPVTVTIASDDTSVARVTPSSLSFSTTNWDTVQTVRVTAVDDAISNSPERMARISHTASGADYTGSPVSTVTVTATDDDQPGIKLSRNAISVDESAGTATYSVQLNTQPTGAVTVTVAGPSGTTGVTGVSPTSLSFTETNWNQPQLVTVTVMNDYVDNADRMATITHSATGGGYADLSDTVTVTVVDDDMRGVDVDESALTIVEGGSGSYVIQLNSQPTGSVTVTAAVSNRTGPRNVTFQKTSNTFTTSEWDTPWTVMLNVSQATTVQPDTTLTVTHTVSGGDYVGVTADSVEVFIPGLLIADDEVTYMVPADGMVMVPDDPTVPNAVKGVQLSFSSGDTPTVTMSEADPAEEPEEKPSGFMTGGHVVDIQLPPNTILSGPVTICLPREGGGRVYRWDDQVDPADWVALDLPPDNFTSPGIDYACGQTMEFSLFAAGSAPSVGVPKARMAQLGRVLAGQVVDAVQDRLTASREAGFKATMAGQALPSFGENSRVPTYASTSQHGSGVGSFGLRDWDNTEIHALTEHSLLSGSSFSLTDKFQGSDSVSVWGQASITGFDGEGLEDGQMTTGFFGADWTSEELTAGLALSLSRGKGTWTSNNRNEEFDSTLTSIHPYFGYALSNRTSIWGVAGYGQGEVDTTDRGMTTSADMDMLMLAGGTNGDLSSLDFVSENVSLLVKSDALLVSMSSGQEDADVMQIGLALELSRRWATSGDGEFKPSAEIGLRLDGGDAETGLGFDVGLGFVWRNPTSGVSAGLQGRALITHANDSLSERGFSGSFGWDPSPGSAEGANLTVSYIIGDSATGGAEALFNRNTLSAVQTIGDDPDSHRMEIRLGYGMPVWGSRFIGTPQTAFGYSDNERDVSLGWNMNLVDRSSVRGTGSLGLSVEARRSESASDGYRSEDEIVFRLRTQF